MINISKLLEGLAISLSRDKFLLATLKLTIFYVFSTAIILFVSSVAMLFIFAPKEIEIPFQDEVVEVEVEHSEWSVDEIREHLVSVVMIVDFVVLFFVSIFSYYFARKTLLPIKKMHEEQKQFMSDVAHELRTPLSVMQAGADTLLKKKRTTSEYEEFIIDIQEETGRLTRLSNQLLQLLRSEHVQKKITKQFNLSNLITVETRRFQSYAKECKITVVGNISPAILLDTDADSFIEITQNLLKNAIDYNKQDGLVTIKLSENNLNVILEIVDTGIGIPTEMQTTIFNRFVKVDNARTQTASSGAGLGLAIVSTLVSKLGGKITLKSELNVGTTIIVTLPKVYS